jgi:hypothetical protein
MAFEFLSLVLVFAIGGGDLKTQRTLSEIFRALNPPTRADYS